MVPAFTIGIANDESRKYGELSMSLSPIGSSTVAKPHKLPLAIGFQDTSRIRGRSAARAGLASSVAPQAADSARRN